MPAHTEMKTFYDSKTKIWSGKNFESVYNLNKSLGSILYEELRKRPKSICQISDSEGTILTNEDALLQAIRIALNFKSQGIKQSDIIGIVARNTTYLMAVILATFFNGSAFHAVNPKQDTEAVNQLFSITKPKIIFCDGQDYEKIKKATSHLNVKIITLIDHIAGLTAVTDLLHSTLDEDTFLPAELESGTDQIVGILCSSGTSGFPKAITLSNKFRFFEALPIFTDQDVIYVQSTFDWISAFYNFTTSIIYGFKRIISYYDFSPEYYINIVDKYKVTYTLGSPNYLAKMLNCPDMKAEKLNSLRIYMMGGGKCTAQTQRNFQDLLKNGRLTNAYTFTEFEYLVAHNFNTAEKPNSVGNLVAGVEAKIIDENGMLLGPGEIGEICCWHGRKWLGYYNNKEATDSFYDKDYWYYSGDLGYFDKDNYLYIVERKKDMLKYMRMTYYPHEIENVIAEMPEVADVCVCGVWNEMDGEAPAAAVVKRAGHQLTAEDVINYVRENIEADHKQLHGGVMILSELPKSPNGKVNRRAVRDLFTQHLEQFVEK